MHEWMADNGFTPHLVVDARREGVRVPDGHAQDGKIVLNVSASATRGLALGNEFVSFEARFGGVSRRLEIPIDAVLGIYARETGQGMIFGEDDSAPDSPTPPGGSPSPDEPPSGTPSPPAGAPSGARKAKLTVIK
jgi:stringent starvation protein B